MTKKETDALRAALEGIRDCAKGIMPIHSGKPDKELQALMVGAKDARWTRLFAIYSAAEAALAQEDDKIEGPARTG